jgi:hypothetical protein
MSANNNTKLISIVVPIEEEKFIDDVPNNNTVENLENGLVNNNNDKNNIPEVKSILKKTNREIERDNKIKAFILQFISILFVALFVSPFVICDLVFGYNDDSCVDIYPENMSFINMKIYLLVSGYLAIGLLSCIIVNLYFASDDNIGNNIILVAFLSIVLYISQVFFVIWNILGAVIFWGTLNKHNYCSKSINTYLFVSLIMKLFANFCNIMATKDKKNEKK